VAPAPSRTHIGRGIRALEEVLEELGHLLQPAVGRA
jgi:hypothetical protein